MRHLLFAVVLLGCNTPKPAEGPKPAPELTPAALCERYIVLTGHAATAEERAQCVSKMSATQKDDPPLYTCAARCAEKENTEAAAESCIKTCMPPRAKKALDAETEALNNLRHIEIGAFNRFQQETDVSGTGGGPYVHKFCSSTKAPVPAELPAVGAAVGVTPAAWDTDTWLCLKFAVNNEPLFNQYSFESNDEQGEHALFKATARRRLPSGMIHVITLTARGTTTDKAERVSLITRDEP